MKFIVLKYLFLTNVFICVTLKCATSGINDDDALLSARELLGCVLYGLEEDKEEIPSPTPLAKVEIQPNERAVLVDVYMPSIRQAHVNRSVNRTVTLHGSMPRHWKEILIFHRYYKML